MKAEMTMRHPVTPGHWQRGIATVAFSALLAAGACAAGNEEYEPGSRITKSDEASVSEGVLKPALVAVDFGAVEGALRRTEQFNTWDNGDPEPGLRADDAVFLNEQGLHSKLVRVGFDVSDLCDAAASECDFSPIADWLDDISVATDSLVVHLTPKQIIHAKQPPSEARPLLKLAIRELKRRFPKIDYIEATNEPDWEYHGSQIYAGKTPILQPDEVYPYYVPFYQAVNDVNEALPQSEQLRVGGPALTGMTETWMTAFLDGYAADPNPGKRLDFISYHGYGEFSDNFKEYHPNKADLSKLATQRARLDQWLQARQLTVGIPVFITETGIYPGPSFDEPDPGKTDYLRQAAGLASQHYWWAEQDEIYPFNWVVRHATQGRKDQLITHAPEGPQARTFSPYGNMLLMQSRMKDTRVEATSDSLEKGRGVYALAAMDDSGASIMVWNYQHISDGRFETTIAMSNLPDNLQGKKVHQRVYKIDAQTSNYWTNSEAANLQQVSESIIEPGQSYSLSVNLSANALQLILLEPVE